MIDQTTTTHTTADSPLITVNQISLSAKQIWTIIFGSFTLLAAAVAQGYLYVPAKANDLTSLSAIVATIQQQHIETRANLVALGTQTAKLSEAVDGLTETVLDVGEAVEQIKRKPAASKRASVKRPAGREPRRAAAVYQHPAGG